MRPNSSTTGWRAWRLRVHATPRENTTPVPAPRSVPALLVAAIMTVTATACPAWEPIVLIPIDEPVAPRAGEAPLADAVTEASRALADAAVTAILHVRHAELQVVELQVVELQAVQLGRSDDRARDGGFADARRVDTPDGAAGADAPHGARQGHAGRQGQVGRAGQAGRTGPRTVNINTASGGQLQRLPRVGPATARNIIAHRPYGSVDELRRVPGIGAATLEQLRPLVTVD